MSRYDVANLKVRLGDYKIKTAGETKIFESKAARVVRHKEFTQQTLVFPMLNCDIMHRNQIVPSVTSL